MPDHDSPPPPGDAAPPSDARPSAGSATGTPSSAPTAMDAGTDAAGAQPAAAPRPAPETPEQRADRAEREKAELHDRYLRLAADFENYKRRVRREIDEAASRGREALLKEILPVLDNLDRALVAIGAGGGVEALGEGVRLVDRQFHGVLEKFGVKRFDALHTPFDPARHEAIQQVDSADAAPGHVAQVFARGYLIGDRLLRPALVAVARPAAAPPSESSSGEGDSDEGSTARGAPNGGAPPEEPLH